MKQVYYLIIAVIGLTLLCYGCLTEKNLGTHNDKYPLAAAIYAAKKWPCAYGDTVTITKVDSTNFNLGVGGLDDSFGEADKRADSIIKVLEIDSSCVKYKYVLSRLREQIREARRQLVTLPPIFIHDEKIVKVFDSAKYTAIQLQLQKSDGEYKKSQTDLMAAKDKLNWWKIAAIITWAICAVGLGIKLYLPKV